MIIKRMWSIAESEIIYERPDAEVKCFINNKGKRTFTKPSKEKCESVVVSDDNKIFSGIPAYLIINWEEIPMTIKEAKTIFNNYFFK